MTKPVYQSRRKSTFSNQTYDVLKFIALIFLPAAGSLYFALAGIWQLPDAQQVVGTVSVVDTFLGLILGISTTNYKSNKRSPDGDFVINHNDPNKDVYSLELATGFDQIEKQDHITLKVRKA